MNREEFLRDCWAYYKMLEDKFIHTLNYVALSKDNELTFSNEYAGLIQLMGSELDSFFKIYCGFKQNERKKISDYYAKVTQKFPNITTQVIKVPLAKMTVCPFDGWDKEKTAQSLEWWMAFNQIKHSRSKNSKAANQKNTLYCLAALFLLEMDYLHEITKTTGEPNMPDDESSLFFLQDWDRNCVSFGRGAFGMLSN